MSKTYRWIHKVWYEKAPFAWVLLPLSALYQLVSRVRRFAYRKGWLPSYRAAVPVIVVGNITAGGTGKTPTVIWLVEQLKSRGFKPGIVSRGYGGSHSGASMRVDRDSDAAVAGDEPVLLARRTGCPVAVDADRLRASAMLVEDGVDIIVADDGLQHYRLRRDFEICVVDGARGLGNGRLLPAGPLREPATRLNSTDVVLVNGSGFATNDSIGFQLVANAALRLNGSQQRPLTEFSSTTVHAVAAIGNPHRFFDLLRSFGMQVIEHALRDHERLNTKQIAFGDRFDVFMTEKDAVKLRTTVSDRLWMVPVDLAMEDTVASALVDRIEARIKTCEQPE